MRTIEEQKQEEEKQREENEEVLSMAETITLNELFEIYHESHKHQVMSSYFDSPKTSVSEKGISWLQEIHEWTGLKSIGKVIYKVIKIR